MRFVYPKVLICAANHSTRIIHDSAQLRPGSTTKQTLSRAKILRNFSRRSLIIPSVERCVIFLPASPDGCGAAVGAVSNVGFPTPPPRTSELICFLRETPVSFTGPYSMDELRAVMQIRCGTDRSDISCLFLGSNGRSRVYIYEPHQPRTQCRSIW